MPTYVYKCDSCGVQFEQFQSFKDEPLRACPACAGAVRRVFQPVGIVFKGSGWYITDSRKSSSATVQSNEDSTKSETTPAKTDAASSDTSEPKKDLVKTSESAASSSTASTSASSSATA